MADYREISQEYAKGALNTATLINGGAAVALLSQIGTLATTNQMGGVRVALTWWAAGTSCSAAAWVFGFLSTRFVDKSERERDLEERHLKSSDRWMSAGVLAIAASIGAFIVGCVVLARSFG